MKSKEYFLECCESAVHKYFSTEDTDERAYAAFTIDIMTDILEPEEIPLHLMLKMHHVLFDALITEYENRELVLE